MKYPNITVHNFQKNIPIKKQNIEHIVRLTLDRLNLELQGCVAVCVLDDAGIERLNKEFHHTSGPTDVLAFGTIENGSVVHADIAVSAETARYNAREYGTTPLRELALYVIHGLLHIAGYDDHRPTDRKKMRRKEREILCKVRCSIV